MKPLVCLCLTAETLEKNAALVETYRNFIDIAELRADFLSKTEQLKIRQFPEMVKIPCILTIRRAIDGGQFLEGEAARTVLFARSLAFATQNNPQKNFAYIDFEEDFHVQSLQDAANAFGIKIIRSFHDMKNPVSNIVSRLKKMRNPLEIPKIAFMPHSLLDIKRFYEEALTLENSNQILCAMGPMGTLTRIFAARFKSFLTYTSPRELSKNLMALGQVDPITLKKIYRFDEINENTNVFGITGWPLKSTLSPALHNLGYKKAKIDAVYVPIPSADVLHVFEFSKSFKIQGFSVTIPHKEKTLSKLQNADVLTESIGACNTVVKIENKWAGFNTDATGFKKAILEFVGKKNLKRMKVAIIGAGGAARAIACAVKDLGAKACIFNRTLSKAQYIAEKFGLSYATLGANSSLTLKKFSDLIIQTTSKGMDSTLPADSENDPLWFYDFTGKEKVFDIIYKPEVTPLMWRAEKAGCKISNGFSMLKYQGYEQFKLFTGEDYPKDADSELTENSSEQKF